MKCVSFPIVLLAFCTINTFSFGLNAQINTEIQIISNDEVDEFDSNEYDQIEGEGGWPNQWYCIIIEYQTYFMTFFLFS